MPTTRASAAVAGRLRERILAGEYPVGAPLPAERELVDRTGTSRATVREALRILEAQDLVEIRLGRAGGAVVRHPDDASVAASVELLVRGRRLRTASVHETREAVEPTCARLAARHRTVADLTALDDANDALATDGDLAAFLRANLDWHLAVAAAGRNEILAGLLLGLSRAILATTDDADFVDEDVRALTVRAHRSVTRAIRARDAAAAERRMSRHLHAYVTAAWRDDGPTTVRG